MSHQGKIREEGSSHELLEVFRICKEIHCALFAKFFNNYNEV